MANKIPTFDEWNKNYGSSTVAGTQQTSYSSALQSFDDWYTGQGKNTNSGYKPTYGRTDVVTKYEARKAQQSKTDKLVPAAKQSLISYDATGKVDAGSTVRNLFKVMKTAKQDAKAAKEEYKERGARMVLNPETNRYETVDASGKPYSASAPKAFSDEWAADKLGLTSGAKNISGNAEAAKKAGSMGVPTTSIEGSFSRETLQEQIKQYSDMTFGQRAAANVGLTAGNYALDLANAGLTAANALSFGKLQNGSGKASSIYNALNLIQNGASEDLSQNFALMRENSNWLGKFVLDLEKTGIEQIIDRTIGTAIGGGYGSLAVMGARVFGSGTQEAENEGKTIIKQLTTGFVRGGVELGTEMLGGVGGSWRGAGYGDKVFEKLGEWVAKKTNSEFVGTIAQAFGSEAVEELLADVFNPLLDRLFKLSDGDQTFLQEVWGDGQLLYDGLLGGVAGALGGGSSYAAKQAITGLLNNANAKALATDVATYKLAENIATNEKLKAEFERYSGAELSDETDEAIAQIAVIFDTYSTVDNQQALVDEAIDINPGNVDAKAYAERLKQGGLMTAKEVNNLIRQNGESIQAMETAEPSPAAALVQNIETVNNVPAAAAEAQEEPTTDTNVGIKTAEQNIETAKNVPSTSPAVAAQTETQEEPEESTVTPDEAAKDFGKQAGFFKSNYKEGQDVDRYHAAYKYAWDYGYGGGKESWLGEAASYLTDDQKHFAWKAGVDARNSADKARAAEIKSNGLTGHKEGRVLYQGVTADDIKAFNVKQSEAHKILTAIAKATGIDIVLTNNAKVRKDGRLTGEQGKYSRTKEPGTIYIDINAGLNYIKSADDLANYTMLRTFCHEFTHFLENWNPVQYTQFRQLVFDTMEANGANVNDMIETKIAEYEKGNVKLTYDGAAREIVAQGMVDILPDSKFIETLTQKNPSVAKQLLEKLKAFLDQIKSYWEGLKPTTEQARALKKEIGGTVRYIQEIVDAFDEVAVGAVENFQSANAVEEAPKQVTSKLENADKSTVTAVESKQPQVTDQVKPAAAPYVSENGYTITDNSEYGSIEISFAEKPSDEVRAAMKANDFHWNGKKRVWYGKTSRETIIKALDAAYASTAKTVEETAPTTEEETPTVEQNTPTAENAQEEKPTPELTAEAAADTGIPPTSETAAVNEESTAAEIIEAAEKDAVEEPVPPKAETEEAKQEIKREIKKFVRFPIETSNDIALETALKSKELSIDNVTLPGNVNGFNKEQRAYIVKNLIEGFYDLNKDFYSGKIEYPGGSGSIKLDVPYDGKFTVNNDINYVLHVLKAMKATVTQDVEITKALLSVLRKGQMIGITKNGDQHYISNGAMLIPISESTYNYAKENKEDGIDGLTVRDFSFPTELVNRDYLEVAEAPKEITYAIGEKIATVYAFETKKGTSYFDKRFVSYLDGGTFYLSNSKGGFEALKATDADGNVIGYLLPIRTGYESIENGTVKPSYLKSFRDKKTGKKAAKEAAPAKSSAENASVNNTAEDEAYREKQDKKETARQKKVKNDSAKAKTPATEGKKTPPVVESTTRISDFGEKIGGARKDWRSDGLSVSDLSDMNDRERAANIKKDNIWKRPDYKKRIEGGADRSIQYAINEIRKALNAKPFIIRRTDTAQAQEDYVATIRKVQELAENATSKEDLRGIQQWLLDEGYLTIEETHGRKHPRVTDKYRKNSAFGGSSFMQVLYKVADEKADLLKAADKANFAVDAGSRVPAGFDIVSNKDTVNGNSDTWFIRRGSYIVKDGFASYEEALKFLQNARSAKERKTRFVPEQLLEVHRKGPNYRASGNVTGQDYINRFGFKGGEFGNWMTEKDRQASLNYGYDALMDLADALGMDYTDISLGGNLNIAFGARGQGLSGASAHYERERHVINLTKMNGAGSLAHEWFHALDDFIGGYGDKMATDKYWRLPENTKAAVRNLIQTMQYREGTQEETDLAAQKRIEQQERHITYILNDNFRWVAKVENGTFNPETDGRYFKTQPTEADAKAFRDLEAAILENGDNTAVEKLSDLRKKINGHVIEKETRNELATAIYVFNSMRTDENVPVVTKKTQFYEDSREFGNIHSKDGDYWDSTVEMSARAFATYVYDKLNGQNDYLEAHANSAVAMTEDRDGNIRAIYAYPRGEERVKINAAFDQLIAALKDDGFIHSQEETARPDTTQYQLRDNQDEPKPKRNTIPQSEINAIQQIPRKSVNDFSSSEIRKLERYAAAYFKQMGVKSPFFRAWFGDWREKDQTPVAVTKKLGSTMGPHHNDDTGWDINVSRKLYSETKTHKMPYNKDAVKHLDYIDDIIKNAILLDTFSVGGKGKSVNSLLMHSLYAVVDIGSGQEVIKLYVEEMNDPNIEDTAKRAYQLQSIEKYQTSAAGSQNTVSQLLPTSGIKNVSDLFAYVKNKDSSFKPKQSSKVLDEKGRPLVVYHGTNNEFTVFNGDGNENFNSRSVANWFTDSEKIAGTYAPYGRLMKLYLNMKNPLIINAKGKWHYQVTYHGHTGTQKIAEMAKRRGYDGVIFKDIRDYSAWYSSYGTADVYATFKPNQEKSATDNIGTFDINEDDIQDQLRDNILSDREVLELAAEQINIDGLTAGEKDGLRIFKERLDKQREFEEHRKELGQLYKEQQFGANVDRKEAQKTLNRMKILDEQIAKQKALVLGAETSNALQQVLPKARKVVEQIERERGQEMLRTYRQRRNEAADVKKYRAKLTREVNTLRDWMLKPDNKNALKHVPDTLKKPVIDFISRIDFTSKRQLAGGEATKADIKWRDSLKALKTMLDKQKGADEEYFGYDLPPQFIERVDEMIDTIQGYLDKNTGDNVYTVNQMSAKELKDLASIVHTCKKLITGLNSFHQNGIFQHVDEAGDADVQNLKQYKNGNKAGTVNDFLMWQQMRPAYAFERFGPGGKAIYKELEAGQATLARNAKKIIDFAKEAYKTKEVKAWEKETKTFEFGDDTVEIPVSGIMSLYELSKRPQALSHILGDGIRVATYKTKVTWEKQDGKILPRRVKSRKISDIGHMLTSDELDEVISSLSARQKEVADKLQQFMQKQGGEWGNHVSRARFGEDLFGEEHYFPINSDGTHLNADTGETPANASLYALLNMGFTKPLQEGANNRIILYSIFDVFSNHMSSMAQYNAFALPVIDTLKWFNYHTDTDSVRDEMARVFGRPEEETPGSGKKGYAERFVINFVRSLNGTDAQGSPQDAFAVNALHRYNVGKVAYNVRVMVQQPLAITRAGMILNTDDIIKGLKMSPEELKANIEEMEKYSGIAAWKGLGFYDVNISRGISSMIKHDDTAIDKINDVGLKGAEFMDKITWAAMWNASKSRAAKNGFEVGSKEFFEETTSIFEEVIYKTQVVDSVLTKSEWMRSKGAVARATSSFMSEATTTVSMVLDAYNRMRMDMQRGQTFQQAWQKNWRNIGRTMLAYAAGEILGAAVTAVVDGFRDDDDYETMWQKIREAFAGNLFDNLNPLMKLPIVSDIFDAAKLILNTAGVDEILGMDIYGYEPNMIYMNWIKSLEKAAKGVNERFVKGNDKYKPYYIIYNLLDAISGMTGLPAASASREIITMWNTLVGRMAPGLKVRKYANEPKTAIKYALYDGYLDEEGAVNALVEDAGYELADAKHDVRQWIARNEYAEWDTDKSGTITQAEAFESLKDYPIKERREIWDMFGWAKDYDTYAAKH